MYPFVSLLFLLCTHKIWKNVLNWIPFQSQQKLDKKVSYIKLFVSISLLFCKHCWKLSLLLVNLYKCELNIYNNIDMYIATFCVMSLSQKMQIYIFIKICMSGVILSYAKKSKNVLHFHDLCSFLSCFYVNRLEQNVTVNMT